MGLAGISVPQLAIILLIVVMLFGTKHLKTLGGDLGGALRGFRKAMDGKEPEEPAKPLAAPTAAPGTAAEQNAAAPAKDA